MILKNFWYTLRTYRQSTLFNVMGLTLAFAACYIIFVQTSYELRFGQGHRDADRIYRVNTTIGDKAVAASGGMVRDYLLKDAQVKRIVMMDTKHQHEKVSIERNGEQELLQEHYLVPIDSLMNEFFEFDMVAGTFDVLHEPHQVIMPKSMAEKFYGSVEDAMGQTIWGNFSEEPYTVGGVYHDHSKLHMLPNRVYHRYEMPADGYYSFQSQMYMRLAPEANIDSVAARANEKLRAFFGENSMNILIEISFTPLTNIYFDSKVAYGMHPTGNRTTSMSLLLVALLILCIAVINFVNFAIAIAPRRIKALNTYRVLGHSRLGLRLMLLSESLITAFIAAGIAVGVAHAISNTKFAQLIVTSIKIGDNLSALVVMGCVALVVGVIAGIYPAIYNTRFSPAMVLNGGRALPKSALSIRQVLLSVQYVVSITLIIVALFIYKQNHFLLESDKGYDSNRILLAKIRDPQLLPVVRQDLLNENDFITSVTFTTFLPGTEVVSSQGSAKLNGEDVMLIYAFVDPNFLEFMDITLVEGDAERLLNTTENAKYAVLNLYAKERYGIKIGDIINAEGPDPLEVIGFAEDIKHTRVRKGAEEPLAYVIETKRNNLMLVRYRTDDDRQRAMKAVEQWIEENTDGSETETFAYRELENEIYEAEQNLSTLISWAAVLAIFISIIGVVGLISLESQQRVHEIAIRKVHGAHVSDILRMLNAKFAKTVCVCYVLAVPIAYLIVQHWLEGFHYRVSITPWIFIAAGVMVLALTIGLVTAQSYRAAMINPTKAMK